MALPRRIAAQIAATWLSHRGPRLTDRAATYRWQVARQEAEAVAARPLLVGPVKAGMVASCRFLAEQQTLRRQSVEA